jgi:hypothetical protein
LSKQHTVDTIQSIANEVKKVNGEMIVLSHNDSYADSSKWKGWTSAYEYSARYLSALESNNLVEAGKFLL